MSFLSFICYRAKFQLQGNEMNESRKEVEEKLQPLKNQLQERHVQLKEVQQKHLDTQLPMGISQEGYVSVKEHHF